MAAPVLISVYTRLKHLQGCIDSLKENELAIETDLFIVSDGPHTQQLEETIEKIRSYVRTVNGFKSVTLFAWEENCGGAESVRRARNELYNTFDRLIYMEDDNIVSPLFLDFMNKALESYKEDPTVFGICGYNVNVRIPEAYPYDVYFMNYISAYGWGTWRHKYLPFLQNYSLPDFKSKEFKAYSRHLQKSANNLKRMVRQGANWGDTKVTHYLFQQKMVCLFPCKSLVYNTGWDGSGEHCGKVESYLKFEINTTEPIVRFPETAQIDLGWEAAIRDFIKYPFLGKWKTALYDQKMRWIKRKR
jgi:hypothetical protein